MQKLAPVIKIFFGILIVSALAAPPMHAGEYGIVPMDIQAALFLKLLGLNNDIAKGGNITIHVVNSEPFAKAMGRAIGKQIGNSKLAAVNNGSGAPVEKPSVVYIGNTNSLEELLNYTRANKVLSITGIPDMVRRGATLGVGSSGGKPKILLNLASLKREGVEINPALIKIAQIIK